MDKPEHFELISRADFLKAIRDDLDAIVRTDEAERSHISEEHSNNMGTANRIAELWATYCEKLQSLIRLRSAPEDTYQFIRNSKTGTYGFKHLRQPWQAIEKPYAADTHKHSHGPSLSANGYL